MSTPNQEGLPDYWGIETSMYEFLQTAQAKTSGRITRLLGY